MFSFAKTMGTIGLILCVQLFLPTKAFAMEEVLVVGYKVVINNPGMDGLYRLSTQWTQVSYEFPNEAQQAPTDDDNPSLNICAQFDNPDGSISPLEQMTIYLAVSACLASVGATTAPAAFTGALVCLTVWGILTDQMCAD